MNPNNLHELLCALTDDYKYIEIENKSQQYKLKSVFSQVRKLQSQKSVRFSSDRPQLFDVPAYSRLYGCLPSAIVATNNGWKSVSARANHWTGKSTEVMQARQQAISAKRDFGHIKKYRRTMIQIANEKLNGNQTLCETHDVHSLTQTMPVPSPPMHTVNAVRTPPAGGAKAKYKKREGAKKVKAFERAMTGADGLLNSEAATLYRALSARANYLSQDRLDISYCTKELCRDFCQPNTLSHGKLKRIGRYLVGHGRLVYEYLFQDSPSELTTYVDTDFAGCTVTRRSTSGGCVMMGNHCVKHWSKTQSTIALSSGEAELGGIAYGMAQSIGVQSLCADLGIVVDINLFSDATAAIGITKRRGLGKIRHLHTSDLWVQEKVQKGLVKVNKILGSENPADVLTKYVDAKTMSTALNKLNMKFYTGRAASAPATMGRGETQEPSTQ